MRRLWEGEPEVSRGDEGPATAMAQIANGVAIMREALAPVQEATIGYRTMLVEAGMDAANATTCAVQFHEMLVRWVASEITRSRR